MSNSCFLVQPLFPCHRLLNPKKLQQGPVLSAGRSVVYVSGCKSSFIPTTISMTTFPSFCVFPSLRSPYITHAVRWCQTEKVGTGVKVKGLDDKDGMYLNLSGWGLPNNRPRFNFDHLGSKLLW